MSRQQQEPDITGRTKAVVERVWDEKADTQSLAVLPQYLSLSNYPVQGTVGAGQHCAADSSQRLCAAPSGPGFPLGM